MEVDSLSGWRSDAAAWLRLRSRELGIVALIWIGAAVVFYLLADKHVTPRRYQDEFFYWGIAKNLAAGNGIAWRGGPVELRSFLYPLYIAPVFKVSGSVASQYAMVHALNALAAAAAVFPAFLAARAVASRRLALAAAGFAICLPAMNYTGIVGTESLGYPVCMAALAAIMLACFDPRARNAMLAVVAIGIAILVRTQFMVLPGVLVASMLLAAAFRGRAGAREYLRSQRFLVLLIGAGVMLGALLALVEGERVVGIYAQAFHGVPLKLSEFWFWLRSFAADTFLVCGILPAIATWAMLGARENRRDPRIGALLAVALSAAVIFVLQLSWFSAVNAFHWRASHVFYERYLFYIAPLFFAGFAASVGRVRPRAAAVSAAVAVAIVLGFSHEVVQVPFSYDAFGLAYLGYLTDAHESWAPHLALILAGVTAVMGAVYLVALLPDRHKEVRKYGRALAVLLPLFVLLLSQAKSWSYAWLYSEDSLAQQPDPPGFANSVGSGPIALLAADGTTPVRGFQAEFWNPRVSRVYFNVDPPVSSASIYTNGCEFDWDRAGRVLPGSCGALPRSWYLSSQDFELRFRNQLRSVRGGGTRTGELIETSGPPVLLAMTSGVDLDNDRLTDNRLRVWSFLRERGQLRVRVEAPSGSARVKLSDGRVVVAKKGSPAVITQPVAPGEQISVLTSTGSVPPKVRSVQLREGDGNWVTVG